jgi:hypothetical protein
MASWGRMPKFVGALIASNKVFTDTRYVIVSYDTDFDTIKIPRMKPEDVCADARRVQKSRKKKL